MEDLYADLIELKPFSVVNRIWISEVFQYPIRKFDGCLKAGTFPVFLVHGSTEYGYENRSIDYKLFTQLAQQGHGFALVHVMDEIYDHSLSTYGLEKCLLVFREYYRPSGGKLKLCIDFFRSFLIPNRYSSSDRQYYGIKSLAYEIYLRLTHIFRKFSFMKRQYLPSLPGNKVDFIPLGYTDKFASVRSENIPTLAERKYRWSFCGNSFKTDRKLMLSCLADIKPSFVYEYQGFMDKRSLTGEEYWGILTQSMFAPCSLGNMNIDTYRLFEVLEAGAIPIILKSHAWQPYNYYSHLLGEHPIPTFSSWREAKVFLESTNLEAARKLSDQVRNWYRTFKSDLQARVQQSLLEVAVDNLLPHDIKNLDVLC